MSKCRVKTIFVGFDVHQQESVAVSLALGCLGLLLSLLLQVLDMLEPFVVELDKQVLKACDMFCSASCICVRLEVTCFFSKLHLCARARANLVCVFVCICDLVSGWVVVARLNLFHLSEPRWSSLLL